MDELLQKANLSETKYLHFSNQMGCQGGLTPSVQFIYLKRNASKAVCSLKNADEEPYKENAQTEMKEYNMFVKVLGNYTSNYQSFKCKSKLEQ